jgi:hypothetical protein
MDKQKLEVQKSETMQQISDKTAIDAATALIGLKKTNSTVPSYKPKSFLDQIYFYKNDTDYRLYIYLNNEWKYIDFTA